jgi:molecular chaperone GrpE
LSVSGKTKRVLILELDLLTKQSGEAPMEESPKQEDFEEMVKKLEEKLEAEQEKSKEYLNRLKYLQADFENYRKRVEKEIQQAVQRSNEKSVSCLVDLLDDLEKAISAGETTENKTALLEGIKMIHKNLDKLLEQEGVEKLECVGQAFNPNLHEVLAQVPTKEHQSGTVLEEARKGFMFKGKVLRPSIVKIACKVSESDKNE